MKITIVVFEPSPGKFHCTRLMGGVGMPTPNVQFSAEGSDPDELETKARQACREQGITKVVNLDLDEPDHDGHGHGEPGIFPGPFGPQDGRE